MLRLLRLSLCVGIGLLSLSHQGFGDESPSEKKLAEKYKGLIDQLASPNKVPTVVNRESGSVTFPADYDAKTQLRIETVRQELCDHFQKALPFLIEAVDDKRYCMTIRWGEGPQAYHNRSVGEICDDLIRSHLEIYRDSIRFAGPDHWYRYSYDVSNEWWQMRKGKSLAELQIESINWAIELRQAEGEGRDGKRAAADIAALKKLRDGIASTRKPVKGDGMERMATPNKK
ncbi:MAG: hypothetical protein JWP89_2459 [Schlesneria sp.]|nr:hypothetical protein [Schlesneria sp.]